MGLYVVVIAVLILCVVNYNGNQQCEVLDLSLRPFYKIRTCQRSDLPVIWRGNVRSLKDCMDFAKERGGLAINFSPPGASISRSYKDYFFANCQVLGCPEIANSSTLVNDTAFDYYSLFGDLNALEDTSCITSVGQFKVFQDKVNYTSAIIKCQDTGGDLALITSEIRTNGISNLVKKQVDAWYKTAYVGLDDMHKEGKFVNPLNEPLNCFMFRAWGPGHPRNKNKHEDCVIIDSESSWKVMNCQLELSFVCELYPMSPPKTDHFQNVTCSNIKDQDKRKRCRAKQKKQKATEKHENVTISDRCKNEI